MLKHLQAPLGCLTSRSVCLPLHDAPGRYVWAACYQAHAVFLGPDLLCPGPAHYCWRTDTLKDEHSPTSAPELTGLPDKHGMRLRLPHEHGHWLFETGQPLDNREACDASQEDGCGYKEGCS